MEIIELGVLNCGTPFTPQDFPWVEPEQSRPLIFRAGKHPSIKAIPRFGGKDKRSPMPCGDNCKLLNWPASLLDAGAAFSIV
jgi:hypothetical protein